MRGMLMKPPTQPLMKNPRQGTLKTQKATVKSMRTTSYPSPKQLPLIALRNSRSPQKLDMLYSCNWQPMQPLARLKARAKVSPRKVRVKERARLFVVT